MAGHTTVEPGQTAADLRRELALRTAERDEALAQLTATAEVLQVINSSPGDLAPVFDAMLEKAMRLCEADFGALCRFGGEGFRVIATRGFPTALNDFLQGELPVHPGSVPDRVRRGERVIHIPDLTASEGTARTPVFNAMIDLGGARSTVWVDLQKDDRTVGFFAIYRQEVSPFTDKQIALLQNFAAQAVIAMENARLITETREALEQQTATAEVLGVINSSPGDLAPVFDAMLDKAHHLAGIDFGALWTFGGEHFRVVAKHGLPSAFREFLEQYIPDPQQAEPTAFGRLLRGERLVHTPDLLAVDYTATELGRAGAELGGVRTLLLVPLRKDDVLLGFIASYRQEVRPFSDKQIALLENFAAQAVIAMENARLITETREALEQQTATAEVLGVINSSPGDLAPVFEAMLEKAMRLCEAAYGHFNRYDGELFHRVAVRGKAEVAEWQRQRGSSSRGEGTVTFQRLLRGENVIHVPDVMDTDAYRAGNPAARALVDIGGCRTLLTVALRKEDALVGLVSLYREGVRPFSDKQIALLQNFAAQAVIAMENARLLGELRERTEEVAGWNRELEERVAAQLAEIERTGKLRRFLAPQLAEMILARGDESILESHRREIVVVFCDVRGFTGFAERAEPEEVMAFLRDYHAALGPIVARFEGTLDHYSGDGIMVFFNDPLPTPEPAKRAIEMAVAMRETAQQVLRTWRRHGHDIGFGVGISQGYATLGQIGFAERMDYTAIGTVTNLAARLCAEAKDGQILISRRVAVAVEDAARLEEIGDLSLKGLSQAVAVFNVV